MGTAEWITYGVCAVLVITGGLGVVLARNAVHSALFLVQTLFGVAVLFVVKEAYFLAAIQVIVYAGAIVILFLFVIMLLGVDKTEELEIEPIGGFRPLAVLIGAAIVASLAIIVLSVGEATGLGGDQAVTPIDPERTDVEQLGDVLFTDWVFAFVLTGVLLTIAVVGAVVLSRRVRDDLSPLPDVSPLVTAAALPGDDRDEGGDDHESDDRDSAELGESP